MTQYPKFTININFQHPRTEADFLEAQYKTLERNLVGMWKNKIANEQSRGNPLFTNVDTYEKYLAAMDSDEKRKRKELGFWKYHFGA